MTTTSRDDGELVELTLTRRQAELVLHALRHAPVVDLELAELYNRIREAIA